MFRQDTAPGPRFRLQETGRKNPLRFRRLPDYATLPKPEKSTTFLKLFSFFYQMLSTILFSEYFPFSPSYTHSYSLCPQISTRLESKQPALFERMFLCIIYKKSYGNIGFHTETAKNFAPIALRKIFFYFTFSSLLYSLRCAAYILLSAFSSPFWKNPGQIPL